MPATIRAKPGCRHFFGYPIIPSTEGAELMARLPTEIGGVFIQAVSEVAAVNMMYGCGGTGLRLMTFTSSPDFSMTLEGISYMTGTQIPGVVDEEEGHRQSHPDHLQDLGEADRRQIPGALIADDDRVWVGRRCLRGDCGMTALNAEAFSGVARPSGRSRSESIFGQKKNL